jgi:C4-type Zn-finger protein
MIVFFGLYRKRHVVGAYKLDCPVCREKIVHLGAIEKRAVNIFFIPIFPAGSGKVLSCNRCGNTTKIKEFPAAQEISPEALMLSVQSIDSGPR